MRSNSKVTGSIDIKNDNKKCNKKNLIKTKTKEIVTELSENYSFADKNDLKLINSIADSEKLSPTNQVNSEIGEGLSKLKSKLSLKVKIPHQLNNKTKVVETINTNSVSINNLNFINRITLIKNMIKSIYIFLKYFQLQ